MVVVSPISPGHSLPGFAALAREDVADARRRHPDVSLQRFAHARALEFRPRGDDSDLGGLLGDDASLRFNLVTDSSRHVVLFHWARPWPVLPGGDPGLGTFYGRVWSPPRGPWWYHLKPNLTWLSWLPFVGWLFAMKQVDTGAPPYRNAIGVPCTAVAVTLPLHRLHPSFRIDSWAKPRFAGSQVQRLDPWGLAGWTLIPAATPLSRDWLERFLTPEVRGLLELASALPFFELRVNEGLLQVCRNGYVADDASLLWLHRAAMMFADAVTIAAAQ